MKLHIFGAQFLSSTFLLTSLAIAQTPKSYLVTIEAAREEELFKVLEQRAFDIAGHSAAKKRLEIVTTNPDELKQLATGINGRADLNFKILSIEAEEPYANRAKTANDQEDYIDGEAAYERLRRLAFDHDRFASVINLNSWLGISNSSEGRSTFALRVGKPELNSVNAQRKVLILGQHHARELMTHHAVIDLAQEFLEGLEAQNPLYTQWLEQGDLWFVPVVNPDGLQYVFSSNRMWRKNRRNNADGSYGVDLNRNYAFKWGECGQTSPLTSSETYRGPLPQSEPETIVMDRLNNKVHFQYALSFHSAGNELLYPYRCGQLTESAVYSDLSTRFSAELNFGTRHASGSGEDFEHHYARYGTLAFLLEIGESFQPPFASYRNEVWPAVKKSLPFILGEALKPELLINTTDQQSNAPVMAALSIEQISFKEGEQRNTDALGNYHWRLRPGTYTVTAKAPGYLSQSQTIEIKAGVEAHLKFLMIPG